MATQKEFQESVIKNFEKLENSISAVNAKIDTLNSQDVTNLKLQVAKLESRLTMVTSILGAIGVSGLGLAIKAIFK